VNAIERIPLVGNTLQTFVIPKNQFSILATQRMTSRLLLTLDTLVSGDYLSPVFGEVTTQVFRFNGIHKLNLGASYRIPLAESKALRLFIRTENLLGQTYFESGFPAPGRTARGGIQFEF
jgi:outer membrane receptor protein involved in Fe transport